MVCITICIYVFAVVAADSPSSTSTVIVPCVSKPSSCVTVSHTTICSSRLTSHSDVECLTTSSSVVTSISGQDACTITTVSGMRICIHSYMAKPL